MKFEKDAFKHCTKEQIEDVLSDPFKGEIDIGPSKRGYPRRMFVGATSSDVVLEVGVEFRDDDDYIFHAMKALKKNIEESGFDG